MRILPFGTKWLELEVIMLSEIREEVKDSYQMVSVLCGI